jgi:hypothetical protein
MSYKNQYHVFKTISYGGNNNRNIPVNANVPFKVKKIKFGFSYVDYSTQLPSVIVTSNITNNDIVGYLGKFALIGTLSANITPANLLSAAVENTQQLVTPSLILGTLIAGGQLPTDTVATISIADFNANAILTNTNPMHLTGNLTVNFAYPALTSFVSTGQFTAANCTNNAGVLNIANVLSGRVQTGVSNNATLSVSLVNFAAALCSNANPSVMGNGAGMTVTVDGAGILPQGTTALISKATWDGLGINGSTVQVNLPAATNLPITLTIPATTAYITVAQFDTANASWANNPVSIANNCAVTLHNASGDNLTTLRIDTANFLAAGIINRLYASTNIPVTLLDTVGNSFPSGITGYVTAANFNAAAINKNNNPLTVGGAIAGTLSNDALALSLTQANFNAATIANTNNPLTVGANIPITINAAANIPTYYSSDSMSESNSMHYIFREPREINGDILFTFLDANLTNDIISNKVVVHMEFLGE